MPELPELDRLYDGLRACLLDATAQVRAETLAPAASAGVGDHGIHLKPQK